MARHNEKGKTGEKHAVKHLVSKGHKILETNWRCGKKEVDIISVHGPWLVFTEVKTRSLFGLERPGELIPENKQHFITWAADHYLRHWNGGKKPRFDVILVSLNRKGHGIEHIEDAFSASG